MCKHPFIAWLITLFLYFHSPFSAFGADAALVGLTSPARPFVSGNQTLTYTLKNNGTQSLSSATLKWGLLGESLNSFDWSGNLLPGQSASVSVGSFVFLADVAYELTAFVSAANGGIDSNHANDTLNTYNYAAAMPGGVYTIGGLNPNYPNLNIAVGLLNGGGVFGPVTFLLRNGTYNEQIYINDFAGNGESRPIIFRSETSDADNVTVQSDGTSVITVNGADYVTFRQLTIKITNPATSDAENGNAVQLRGQNSHICLEDCSISGIAPFTIGHGVLVEEGSDNLLIKNSSFRFFETDIGFNVWGIYENESPLVKNCSFGSEGKRAIFASSVSNIHVEQCDFLAKVDEPVWFENCSGATSFTQNSMQQANKAGLVMRGCTSASGNAVVANNYIKTTVGNAVEIRSCTGLKLLYNTFRLENAGGGAFALTVDSSANVLAFNNIFYASGSNTMGGSVWLNQAYNFDHNDFFTTVGFRAQLGTTTYNSLSDWQAATQNNNNSISVNPEFSGVSHAVSSEALNGAATTIPSILTDLDGDPRDVFTPDIGADEFGTIVSTNADLEVMEVLAIPSNCVLGSNEVVKIRIRNNGPSVIQTFSLNYTVNGNTPVYAVFSGDSMVSGQIVVYTFSQTADLSTDDVYQIVASVISGGDSNVNNNSASQTVNNYTSPSAVIVASPSESACPGGTTNLSVASSGIYQWSTGETGNAISVSPSVTTTYTVTVTSNTGCSASDTQKITVVSGITWYADVDNDGFGNSNSTSESCEIVAGYVANSDDCDDSVAEINPDATESCDNLDNDCDGIIDNNALVTECVMPTDFNISNITNTAALLEWQQSGCVQAIRIHWRKVGSSNWLLNFSDSSSLQMSNLAPNTTYEVKIRSFCGGIWNSEYTPLQTFTTSDAPIPVTTNGQRVFIVPNPIHSIVTVSMHNLNEGTCQVRLLGIFGQKLSEQYVDVLQNSITAQFDMSVYPSGIYSFQVELPNGRVFARTCFKE